MDKSVLMNLQTAESTIVSDSRQSFEKKLEELQERRWEFQERQSRIRREMAESVGLDLEALTAFSTQTPDIVGKLKKLLEDTTPKPASGTPFPNFGTPPGLGGAAGLALRMLDVSPVVNSHQN